MKETSVVQYFIFLKINSEKEKKMHVHFIKVATDKK